ncbi:hypothetical protein [uncultured Nostoc sp.]|uniref:hypothetical protein n=1 Tax=uncultured Nostoc sp. TaxID=340711 RepID=UPI0035CA91BF
MAGWWHIEVTERRTKADFAKQMKNLVDICYRDTEFLIGGLVGFVPDVLLIHLKMKD